MARLEFFFDLGSPYSYLAAHRLGHALSRHPVDWHPFLLGAVFKATGNRMPAATPAKGRYMLVDLHRQAARYGIPFAFPAAFPLNTLLSQRVLAATEPAKIASVSLLLYEAFWVRGEDISDPTVLAQLLGEEAVAAAAEPEAKDRLRATTDLAVSRGAFGAPTFFVGEQMYFGHDRLDEALEQLETD